MSTGNVVIIDVSKESKNIIEKIDQNKFLYLDKSNCSRIDLFLFAMALGRESLAESELVNKETFVRDEYVPVKYKALIDSVFIQDSDEEELDKIGDTTVVYAKAEKYANTGFQLIKSRMEDNNKVATLKMLKELDNKYESIFGETVD